jgi:hypothetical protein
VPVEQSPPLVSQTLTVPDSGTWSPIVSEGPRGLDTLEDVGPPGEHEQDAVEPQPEEETPAMRAARAAGMDAASKVLASLAGILIIRVWPEDPLEPSEEQSLATALTPLLEYYMPEAVDGPTLLWAQLGVVVAMIVSKRATKPKRDEGSESDNTRARPARERQNDASMPGSQGSGPGTL